MTEVLRSKTDPADAFEDPQIHIAWALGNDGSLRIRKWSQFPFDGATEYSALPVAVTPSPVDHVMGTALCVAGRFAAEICQEFDAFLDARNGLAVFTAEREEPFPASQPLNDNPLFGAYLCDHAVEVLADRALHIVDQEFSHKASHKVAQTADEYTFSEGSVE